MWYVKRLLVLSCTIFLAEGCTHETIDFSCEVPGKAVIETEDAQYVLPSTITFSRTRHELRIEFPSPDGGMVRAKGHIEFNGNYTPTDVDKYGRLRAVFTKDLIETVSDGGAAVFTGYSVSKQEVFRLLFGKE